MNIGRGGRDRSAGLGLLVVVVVGDPEVDMPFPPTAMVLSDGGGGGGAIMVLIDDLFPRGIAVALIVVGIGIDLDDVNCENCLPGSRCPT